MTDDMGGMMGGMGDMMGPMMTGMELFRATMKFAAR
jgi:hypothetical protein